jgi:hypothetical protein
MANNYAGGIRVQRTSDSVWTVYKNNISEGTFASRVLADSFAVGLIGNAAATERFGNKKVAVGEVQLVTLTAFDGTDSFVLRFGDNETVPFVRGTNATAAAIQAALRTLTGDASLTVAGTTDAGPFTVTFVASTTRQRSLRSGAVSGCTLAVTTVSTGGVAF